MTNEQIIAEKKEIKKFNEWRRRCIEQFPNICARVFALRKTGYMGSGFHWGLEKSLGACMGEISNYDKRFDLMARISIEVCWTGLFKDVARIENELKNKK